MLTIIKIYREWKLAQKRSFFKKRTHTHNLNPNILFFTVKGGKNMPMPLKVLAPLLTPSW